MGTQGSGGARPGIEPSTSCMPCKRFPAELWPHSEAGEFSGNTEDDFAARPSPMYQHYGLCSAPPPGVTLKVADLLPVEVGFNLTEADTSLRPTPGGTLFVRVNCPGAVPPA